MAASNIGHGSHAIHCPDSPTTGGSLATTENTGSQPQSHAGLTALPDNPDLVPGMPYRHYKGGAYLVTGVGRFEADMTPVVVYESMRDRSLLWVRHADVFTEPVSTATGDVARFAPHWAPALSCLDFLPRKTVLQVLALYDAPYRKYHDRRHVLEMFEQAHALGIALNPAQALAVLFHDAVYVPGFEHNEAASAALLDTMVEDVNADVIHVARQIILDTHTHEASVPDAATVLDLDLLRLAADDDVFDAHGMAVFDENRGLLASRVQLSGEALYHAFMVRRAAFLGTLAQRPKLFLTTAFADFEGPARRNIARVLASVGQAEAN